MALANNRYRSICAELERRIRGGVYLPGDALPSRFELMEEFSVARATVDRCISELRKKHLVESRHGKGTYVCEGIDCRRYHIAWIGNMICNGLLPAWWRADILPESAFSARSDWGKLAEYDGIIWSMPGGKLLPAIRECQGQVPQVVMNRTYPGIACVSTDHRGAYYEIGLERLRALPESQVYLLRTGYLNSAPEEYRQTGFLDACRQEQRFYEILTMPDGPGEREIERADAVFELNEVIGAFRIVARRHARMPQWCIYRGTTAVFTMTDCLIVRPGVET